MNVSFYDRTYGNHSKTVFLPVPSRKHEHLAASRYFALTSFEIPYLPDEPDVTASCSWTSSHVRITEVKILNFGVAVYPSRQKRWIRFKSILFFSWYNDKQYRGYGTKARWRQILTLISEFQKRGRTTVGLASTIPTSAHKKAQNDWQIDWFRHRFTFVGCVSPRLIWFHSLPTDVTHWDQDGQYYY